MAKLHSGSSCLRSMTLNWRSMLRIRALSKSFGSNLAVDGVSLSIGRGEVVALVGENGAGKTTLMRIVAGELARDGGTIELDGAAVHFRSARDAGAHGIELVHQHFMLVDELTIGENLALTARASFALTSRRAIERRAERIIAESGIELRDPRRRAGDLSVGEKSKLELIKAVSRKPRILILDEPTSVLAPAESAELFRVMRRLAADGTAIVFISHKLPEVLEVADRIVVMRAGRVVAESAASATTADQLANAMVGTSEEHERPQRTSAHDLSAAAESIAPLLCESLVTKPVDHAVALDGVSLAVKRGEIVAILGVTGNGQSELAAALRGLAPLQRGRILLDGRDATPRALLRAARIGHIPEDRTRDGLVAEMTIAENLGLAARRWKPSEADRRAERLIGLYSIHASGPRQRAGDLSGGNQQKVVLAREIDREPEVIIAAEPARGLDIAATRFVRDQLRIAAERGAAILLITSDLDEAFELGSAFHVMYRGRASRRLTRDEALERAGGMMAGIA
ncbi:MAG TPA: ATP-binding cassette domain-containing protein [Thermoanaerobaculia bacterium]|nr:ATP-binding cassette domain-containing protein [Thermoanaerobaculia bacterium]